MQSPVKSHFRPFGEERATAQSIEVEHRNTDARAEIRSPDLILDRQLVENVDQARVDIDLAGMRHGCGARYEERAVFAVRPAELQLAAPVGCEIGTGGNGDGDAIVLVIFAVEPGTLDPGFRVRFERHAATPLNVPAVKVGQKVSLGRNGSEQDRGCKDDSD